MRCRPPTVCTTHNSQLSPTFTLCLGSPAQLNSTSPQSHSSPLLVANVELPSTFSGVLLKDSNLAYCSGISEWFPLQGSIQPDQTAVISAAVIVIPSLYLKSPSRRKKSAKELLTSYFFGLCLLPAGEK